MKLTLLLLVGWLFSTQISFAQDLQYARKIIDTLSSATFWGRGYTRDGGLRAAEFLKMEFSTIGIQPLGGASYYQEFSYPVNTFDGRMRLSINGKQLRPGLDFLVSPESRGMKGSFKVLRADSINFHNSRNQVQLVLADKLTWSVSQRQQDYTKLLIKKGVVDTPQRVKMHIENDLLKDYRARNVCGIIRGTAVPDSIIVITAHYDHLGGMGSTTYFPGANDNASGVALLLSLAKYYASNPPKYSLAFLCFAGEEAGLLGSRYFVNDPLLSLRHIKFLINTDLAGTGDEGITVVNGSVFQKQFSFLKEINDKRQLLPVVRARGKAANSDHHWFTEKGVPSFFIYTMGGIKAYHDVYDRPETLPLTEFKDLFHLLVEFSSGLMN